LCSPFIARNLCSTISLCTRPICLWKLFWCWPKNVGPYAICARWGIFGFQAMVYGSLRWKLMGNYFEELRNLNEELELKFWLSLFRVFFHQGSRGKFFLTPPHCVILIFWSSPCPVTLFGYLLCLFGMPPETYPTLMSTNVWIISQKLQVSWAWNGEIKPNLKFLRLV
jgi:hypothetical protein